MYIDNTYLTNRTIGQPEPSAPTPDASSRLAATGSPPADSSHVPSVELQLLVAQVQQAPDVRPDVLARVAQRLASGYYLSRDAAEQTAEAIQNAQE
jgi:hypothetical protein